MSRADFAGTFPTAPTADDLLAKKITLTYEKDGTTVTETIADQLKIFDPATDLIDEDAEMPTMGAQNGLLLSDMRGHRLRRSHLGRLPRPADGGGLHLAGGTGAGFQRLQHAGSGIAGQGPHAGL